MIIELEEKDIKFIREVKKLEKEYEKLRIGYNYKYKLLNNLEKLFFSFLNSKKVKKNIVDIINLFGIDRNDTDYRKIKIMNNSFYVLYRFYYKFRKVELSVILNMLFKLHIDDTDLLIDKLIETNDKQLKDNLKRIIRTTYKLYKFIIKIDDDLDFVHNFKNVKRINREFYRNEIISLLYRSIIYTLDIDTFLGNYSKDEDLEVIFLNDLHDFIIKEIKRYLEFLRDKHKKINEMLKEIDDLRLIGELW